MPFPLAAIPVIAQAGAGLAQTIFSGAKKAERELENQVNSYVPNVSIMDFYNKALARYNPNPYTSAAYQNRSNIINRNLTTAISAAQDRRAGVGALAPLVQGVNDANARAAGEAEQDQARNLSVLGSAAGMKERAEDRKFDMLYNLKAAKAGGTAATRAAGWNNIFGGLSSASKLLSAEKQYGDTGNL